MSVLVAPLPVNSRRDPFVEPRVRPVVDIAEQESIALERTIRELLQQSGYGLLSEIECRATGAHLVLQGAVDSYYLKQLAQELAIPIAEGRHIQNQIAVGH